MRELQERRPVLAAVVAGPVWGRLTACAAVGAVVVVADQLTKSWALHHLRYSDRHLVGPVHLVLTFNSGAAFSLGRGVTPVVEAAVVVLIVGLVLFTRRAAATASAWSVAGLGLLLGGALSNLGDRVFRHIPGHPGSVIDFIQAVGWWPVFNVADTAVVVGVILLVLGYRRVPPGTRAEGAGADRSDSERPAPG